MATALTALALPAATRALSELRLFTIDQSGPTPDCVPSDRLIGRVFIKHSDDPKNMGALEMEESMQVWLRSNKKRTWLQSQVLDLVGDASFELATPAV